MSATSMMAPSTSSSTCGQSRKVARTSAWNWRYARPLLACGRREYSTSTYSDAECRFEADGAAASEAVRSAQCRALQHSGARAAEYSVQAKGERRVSHASDVLQAPPAPS